jgi:chitin disaccharide deacetylase
VGHGAAEQARVITPGVESGARLLVINADDFGHARGANEGILEAHRNGIVTSTSLMVFGQAAEEAARLARKYSNLSVGLHFAADADVDLDDAAATARAFARQLERFRELMGADPTHVDSHHHQHMPAHRMPRFAELVAPLGVPLRGAGVRYIGGFYGQWEPGVTNLEHVRRAYLVHVIATEALVGFSELACHPARITSDFTSSYLHERAVELQTLTEPGLREEIEALGVRLVSYHDWTAPATGAMLGAGTRPVGA